MFFGVFPRLVQLCTALWKPNTKNRLSPFLWADGSRCIVNFDSYCNPESTQYNVPYCAATILQIAEHDAMHSPWTSSARWLLCAGGIIYLCEGGECEDAEPPRAGRHLEPCTRVLSALVMSSAII
jgi:hypothetical protein